MSFFHVVLLLLCTCECTSSRSVLASPGGSSTNTTIPLSSLSPRFSSSPSFLLLSSSIPRLAPVPAPLRSLLSLFKSNFPFGKLVLRCTQSVLKMRKGDEEDAANHKSVYPPRERTRVCLGGSICVLFPVSVSSICSFSLDVQALL